MKREATMRAAVLYGREDVRVEDVRRPAPGHGEVLIRVGVALTCGTDLKVYRRGYHARMLTPPAVFGHEMAGVIEEVGEGVEGWEPGTAVVAPNSAPCGVCEYCRARREALCDDLLFWSGAYAQFVCLPARVVKLNMLDVPPRTSLRTAALVEPLACAVRGVEKSRVRSGEVVAVIGAGSLGLMLLQLLRREGARVVVAGRRPEGLAVAEDLGAESVVSATRGELTEQLLALSPGGRGFSLVIEAVGREQTTAAALKVVRKGGRLNLFGGCAAGTIVQADAQRLHYEEVEVFGTFHHTPTSVRKALQLLRRGEIDADTYIRREILLDQIPGVFAELLRGRGFLKCSVTP